MKGLFLNQTFKNEEMWLNDWPDTLPSPGWDLPVHADLMENACTLFVEYPCYFPSQGCCVGYFLNSPSFSSCENKFK